MLSEIQKAIIKGSSIKITAGDGFIEILRGRIVNAEKGERYGIEPLLEILKSKNTSWTVEPLEYTPPTTITEGWLALKEKLLPSRGYNENFSLLFYNLDFDENELMRFLDWINATRFTGFVVSSNYLLAFIEGEAYMARGMENDSIIEGEEALMKFLHYRRKLNVYIAIPKVVEIFIQSFPDLTDISQDIIKAIRIEMAEEGESGILISPDRFEVFDAGLRIVNASDEEFVEMGLPDWKGRFAVGRAEEMELKPLKSLIVSRSDLEILQRIYLINVEILGEKVGKDMLKSILEEFKPSATRPDSIINAMKVLIQRAKDIGGKGWLRKKKAMLIQGIADIKNRELREKLEELFKDF